jgi:hypothetical protein
MKINLQMFLWNACTDNHVSSSCLVNFDSQSVQRGNFSGQSLTGPGFFSENFGFSLSVQR